MQHITHHTVQQFLPQHKAFSFEELRLNDIANGRGVLPARHRTAPDPFPPPAGDLVPAHLSFDRSTVPAFSARAADAASGHDIGDNVIFFDVGKDAPKRFTIHEDLVTPRSEFVALALKREWKEAQQRTIPLPDDEPDVFKLYKKWIYYCRIFSMNGTAANQQGDGEYCLLVKAYILGEKLVDNHFKDAIIDCIIDKLRSTAMFDLRLTNPIYNHTPETSPLRRLLQDVYIWSGNAT